MIKSAQAELASQVEAAKRDLVTDSKALAEEITESVLADTTAAARASSNRPPADATLPANPALRSLETRARYGTDAMAEALSQLGGKLPASGAGHLGVTGPDPSPDLRPLPGSWPRMAGTGAVPLRKNRPVKISSAPPLMPSRS